MRFEPPLVGRIRSGIGPIFIVICLSLARNGPMRLSIFLLLFSLLSLRAPAAEPTWQDHPGWKSEFSDRAVIGTALIYDEQANRYDVFDRERAERPFLPASTFKIFNAMVALDTGAVKDEYEVIHWDGVMRQFD